MVEVPTVFRNKWIPFHAWFKKGLTDLKLDVFFATKPGTFAGNWSDITVKDVHFIMLGKELPNSIYYPLAN